MFLKNYNNIITGNKDNDNLILFKNDKNTTKKIKNIITRKNIKSLKKKKLKNILKKWKKTRNISKHDPVFIDEGDEHVVFNDNVYDEDGEEYIPKWKEKQIYEVAKEEGKYEGDKNAYISDLLDYEPIKKIDEKIEELQTNNSKKLVEELHNEIEKLKNDNNLNIQQKNEIIEKLNKKIDNIQKHHSKNRNIKIKK